MGNHIYDCRLFDFAPDIEVATPPAPSSTVRVSDDVRACVYRISSHRNWRAAIFLPLCTQHCVLHGFFSPPIAFAQSFFIS